MLPSPASASSTLNQDFSSWSGISLFVLHTFQKYIWVPHRKIFQSRPDSPRTLQQCYTASVPLKRPTSVKRDLLTTYSAAMLYCFCTSWISCIACFTSSSQGIRLMTVEMRRLVKQLRRKNLRTQKLVNLSLRTRLCSFHVGVDWSSRAVLWMRA